MAKGLQGMRALLRAEDDLDEKEGRLGPLPTVPPLDVTEGGLEAAGRNEDYAHDTGLHRRLDGPLSEPPGFALSRAPDVLSELPRAETPEQSAPLKESTAPLAAAIDPAVDSAATPADGVGISYGQTFSLHSNPGSTYKVFLDFDGHMTTGTTWNSAWGMNSFYSPAFSLDASESFTAEELLRIQQIWQRIAEYFSPFNIDVTTEDPGAAALSRTGATDSTFGIRVVITDENKAGGGTSWKGSFTWNSDPPVFVYANSLQDLTKSIGDAAAHEVGHSLGLDHDGPGSGGYYFGHGTGVTDLSLDHKSRRQLCSV